MERIWNHRPSICPHSILAIIEVFRNWCITTWILRQIFMFLIKWNIQRAKLTTPPRNFIGSALYLSINIQCPSTDLCIENIHIFYLSIYLGLMSCVLRGSSAELPLSKYRSLDRKYSHILSTYLHFLPRIDVLFIVSINSIYLSIYLFYLSI